MQRFYSISQCHVPNVVNNNIFVRFFVYLDVVQIKIFYIDHAIKKVVRTIFDVNFSYTELLIHASQYLTAMATSNGKHAIAIKQQQ